MLEVIFTEKIEQRYDETTSLSRSSQHFCDLRQWYRSYSSLNDDDCQFETLPLFKTLNMIISAIHLVSEHLFYAKHWGHQVNGHFFFFFFYLLHPSI